MNLKHDYVDVQLEHEPIKEMKCCVHCLVMTKVKLTGIRFMYDCSNFNFICCCAYTKDVLNCMLLTG